MMATEQLPNADAGRLDRGVSPAPAPAGVGEVSGCALDAGVSMRIDKFAKVTIELLDGDIETMREIASTASRYGITPQQLAEFRSLHGNKCGICDGTKTLYIDHDHSTGKLRGLLCPSCNTAIGQLREDPALFASALAYLEKNRG